jgi:hypothetical protein
MECSMNARLMFIGMWNFADDLGRLAFAPKTIKAQIFPSDEVGFDAIRGMVLELSRNGLVLIYEVDGKEYLQICGWQHQRIDKPQPGKCPGPVKGYSTNVPGMVATDRILSEGIGKDLKDTRPAVAPRAVDPPVSKKRASKLPDDWLPSERAYAIAEQFGQNVQIVEAIFRDYCASSGKLYADHDAAFHNFIRNQKTFNRGSGDAKPKNGIIQAADDLRRKIASFDGPARSDEELRGGEGAHPPRLLSHG